MTRRLRRRGTYLVRSLHADPGGVWFDPDPKSTSGQSARVVGYSHTVAAVLVVILVHRENGGWWGANGWRANSSDARIYREGTPT